MTDETVALSITRLVARGKAQGYLTFEEVNAGLPADEFASEKIEDALSLFSELGIELVEAGMPVRPAGGKIDHSALTREIIARYPKILAALAK